MNKLSLIGGAALATLTSNAAMAGALITYGVTYSVTPTAVPEMSATGAVAALAVVAAVTAFVWERRRAANKS